MSVQPHYQFLSSQEFTLPYLEFGHGPELLLAFHGFGRSGRDFLPFERTLGTKYTIIAFDFFYHGPHRVPSEHRLPPLSGAQLARMIEKLLWEKKKVRCSMLGYSQGGRIVLGQIHHLPHRIYELIIVAPDGLRRNRIRDFIGRTWGGRLTGLLLVNVPVLIRFAVWLLQKSRRINARQASFYLHQTREKENRYRIYHTWLLLARYNIHRDLIRHYLSKRPISLDLVMGKFDAIIPTTLAKKFLKNMKGDVLLHELECGHDVLQMTDELTAIILRKKEHL